MNTEFNWHRQWNERLSFWRIKLKKWQMKRMFFFHRFDYLMGCKKNAILKMTSSDILNWMDIPEKSKRMKSTLPKIVSILQPC